jgi:hypothetical protein
MPEFSPTRALAVPNTMLFASGAAMTAGVKNIIDAYAESSLPKLGLGFGLVATSIGAAAAGSIISRAALMESQRRPEAYEMAPPPRPVDAPIRPPARAQLQSNGRAA